MSTSRPIFRSEIENLVNFYNQHKGKWRTLFHSTNPTITALEKTLNEFTTLSSQNALAPGDIMQLNRFIQNQVAPEQGKHLHLSSKIVGHLKDIVEKRTIYVTNDNKLVKLDSLLGNTNDCEFDNVITQVKKLREQCFNLKDTASSETVNTADQQIAKLQARAEYILGGFLMSHENLLNSPVTQNDVDKNLLSKKHLSKPIKHARIDSQLAYIREKMSIDAITLFEENLKDLADFGIYTQKEIKSKQRGDNGMFTISIDELRKKLATFLDNKEKNIIAANKVTTQREEFLKILDQTVVDLKEAKDAAKYDYRF